jgi:hypothetical protein
MTRLDRRTQANESLLLERRYIRQVLQEEGKNIRQEQTKRMSGAGFRSSDLYAKRRINVSDNVLNYEHLAAHRFIDMKRRRTSEGTIKKKNYPIHNRVLWGHANNIVRRIAFGFTEDVKAQMAKVE